MAVVDRGAPLQFLRTAFRPDDWVAVFLKSYETGRVSQRVGPLSWVMHERFQAWLRFRNAQRFNIYVAVNAIAAGRRSRRRDSIGAIRHVFLEADRDGPAVLATIAARPDLPEPSYILHSSPNRVHVFWRADGFGSVQVEALQKQLSRELGTDIAATPASQTSRLVGFMNHKYSPAHLVTIEYRSIDHVCMPADFPIVEQIVAPKIAPQAVDRRVVWLDPIERARRYLARVPPAVAGQHGDVHTFRVCCRLVRGFALADEEALALLTDWNTGCHPPWCQHELLDKIRRARRYGREPIAGLLHTAP
jgi:DNA primase RepB-like protein